MSDPDLEARFGRELIRLYERARTECHYPANRFLQMLNERGPLRTARDLLASEGYSEGLTTLWEKKRLDLSLEAAVLREPWRHLFIPEQLATAERRLRELNYPV